jgi:two-component system cell cycle sensor histidine kinase/response regulator CckA
MAWALTAVVIVAAAVVAAVTRALLRSRTTLRDVRRAHAVQTAELRELSKRDARNVAILQSAMDGFFVLDHEYRFREVNDAFCQMTGYSAEELAGMRMTDLEITAPPQSGGDGEYWRTGLHHFATAHRHKSGHTVRLESCVIVLKDGAERILVGFARDVTERCRAEAALRESETKYRSLVETSRDLIWSMDIEGRWTYINNASRSVYGYEPDEMLGRPVFDFVPPQRRALAQAIFARLRDGEPATGVETEHIRKDGSRVQLLLNAIPLRDDHDNVIGFTGTSADISERKQAEVRLQAAHARFESLVEGMPLGYIVWTTDFRVLEWNPAASAIFGYAPEEAIGQAATDIIVPNEAQGAFAEMCRKLLRGEQSEGTVLVNRKENGEKVRCEWYNTVLPDPVGGVHGVATLVRDVSERERLEAQLRQSQKLESLGVLAGGVAHDFNNLLVGILGNASLAQESLPANSRLRGLLDKVINAGKRATDLTKRMLAYAGRASFDVQVMDLNALVEEMADFALAAVPKNASRCISTRTATCH